MRHQGLLSLLAIASILSIPTSASAFSVVFGNRDTTNTRAEFVDSFTTNSSSTVIDDGTNFGAAPATGTVPSVTRNGTVNGESFTYTLYDIDFSNSPTGVINPGNVGGDIAGLDNVTVEIPASQDTASGIYGWGLDSGSGANSTPNALLLDFSNSVGHFGVDLHDFEAGTGIDGVNSGASGQIRVYQSNSLVFSYTLQFPGPADGGSTDRPTNTESNDSLIPGYGNRQSMFVGVTANNPDQFFDQIVFVLGDDDVGNFDDTTGELIVDDVNSGYTERWAADGFTFGEAYNASAVAVPWEFNPSLGFMILSSFWFGNKIKNKVKQTLHPK